MATGSTFTHPKTFKEGGQYVLMRSSASLRDPAHQTVKFLEYCPCPALVLVETDAGEKIRCSRDELYVAEART